jgi:hypothetical protein
MGLLFEQKGSSSAFISFAAASVSFVNESDKRFVSYCRL